MKCFNSTIYGVKTRVLSAALFRLNGGNCSWITIGSNGALTLVTLLAHHAHTFISMWLWIELSMFYCLCYGVGLLKSLSKS